MPNKPQAKKRVLQSEKHRIHNASLRSKYRTYIKKVILLINEGKKNLAREAYKLAVPVLDKMVNKKTSTGLINQTPTFRNIKSNSLIETLILYSFYWSYITAESNI